MITAQSIEIAKNLTGNRFKGYTMLELLVVIAIIATLTSVVIPLINSFSNDKDYDSAVDNLAEQIKLARAKSSAGAVVDPSDIDQKVYWGVRCNSPVGGTTSSKFDVGYSLLSPITGNPLAFNTITTYSLSEKNSSYRITNCNYLPVLFKRISGDLLALNSPDPIGNSGPLILNITNGSKTRTIEVYRSGSIIVK